jgi:iron-sulfur cluster repair protein YtfE (RIC family)
MDLCPQLRRLAEEHARWLELGRRREGECTAEQAARLLAGWEDEIVPHCRAEEEVLLPELARHLSETDAVVVFTHGDHLVLRRLARELRLAKEPARPAALGRLLEKLEEHFRFEEQTLFPSLQQAIGCDCLAQLGEEIASMQGRPGRGPGLRRRAR